MQNQAPTVSVEDKVASETPAEHPLTATVENYATAAEEHDATIAAEKAADADYHVKDAAKEAADLRRDEAEFAHSTVAIAQRELRAMYREYDAASRHAYELSNAMLLAASQRDPLAVEAAELQIQEVHRTIVAIRDRAEARQVQVLSAIGVSATRHHFPNSFQFQQLYNLRKVRDAAALEAIAAGEAYEAAATARARAFHNKFDASQKVHQAHMVLLQNLKRLYSPPQVEFPEAD